MDTTTVSSRDGIPTYHERPAIKSSLYGWTVALYIFVGGLAAGLQIVVTAAELVAAPDSATAVLIGRGIALAGAVLGGVLLILDLHTKQRFYNMLRIFRPTSPMSIGTYALMGFGFWSLVAFCTQLFGLPLVGLICGCLAAATGWWMTTYTAALLSATATPLWAVAPKLLAVRFAASAMSTGAATATLIALGAAPALVLAFGDLAALALLIELIASIGATVIRRRRGVNGPLQDATWGPAYIVGVLMFGLCAPLVLYALANFYAGPAQAMAIAASVCVLAGGLLMRGVILLAGNDSAKRPRDYFRFAAGAT
ncbi:MAG TPA: NrfD/PsrC family molybdoenzyme membrane anchor subunit [Xanthobacteraceae bacterium]|jgi:hypothetical protein